MNHTQFEYCSFYHITMANWNFEFDLLGKHWGFVIYNFHGFIPKSALVAKVTTGTNLIGRVLWPCTWAYSIGIITTKHATQHSLPSPFRKGDKDIDLVMLSMCSYNFHTQKKHTCVHVEPYANSTFCQYFSYISLKKKGMRHSSSNFHLIFEGLLHPMSFSSFKWKKCQ